MFQERIHAIREHLMEAEKQTSFLSSEVSNQTLPADLAPLVDAMRHSVLTAMRVALALELASKLVTEL